MPDLVKVAIVGASGYSGRELLRLLLPHPHVKVVAVTSRTLAGKPLTTEFPRLRGIPAAEAISFSASDTKSIVDSGASVAFLALPHGLAHEFAAPLLEAGLLVIDLSADFRLRDADLYAEFYGHAHPAPHLLPEAVYALPELRREAIAGSRLLACPGCYPTSVLVPLVPLLREGLLAPSPISVSSMSGVSGAGRKAEIPYLFVECNESARAYGAPKHRHLSEIGQELAIAAGRPVRISFVPHLVPYNQGIHTTIFASLAEGRGLDDVEQALRSAYSDRTFIRLLGRNKFPDTKNVSGTNFLEIGWTYDEAAGQLILTSAEDNLVKGASGQAVQCFNLAHGFEETLGLLGV